MKRVKAFIPQEVFFCLFVNLCSCSFGPLCHPQKATDLLSVTIDWFAFSRVLSKWNQVAWALVD